MHPLNLTAGDFIEIPKYKTFGCVENVRTVYTSNERGGIKNAAADVLLAEYPNQSIDTMRVFRLRVGDFVLEN